MDFFFAPVAARAMIVSLPQRIAARMNRVLT
jgi:hypothetical protein